MELESQILPGEGVSVGVIEIHSDAYTIFCEKYLDCDIPDSVRANSGPFPSPLSHVSKKTLSKSQRAPHVRAA